MSKPTITEILEEFRKSGERMATLAEQNGHHARNPSAGVAGGPRLVIRSLSTVAPQEIDWLWRRWLARGHFQLFGGLSGDGKGTIMTNIAAIGSVGGRWPDGSQAPRFNTLFVVGEEGLGTTLRPRLDLHGADTDHIFAIETVLDGEGRDRSFNVRDHLGLLEATIAEYRIDLVVIDPLTTSMPGTNRNDEGDTRDALTPLVKLAERTNVCIKGIAHIGKPTGTTRTTAQRILGATAFHALARIVWVTAKDGEGGMALGVPLSNIAMKPKPLRWSRAEDEPITWNGESDTSIDDLFDGMKLEMPRDKAEGFLRDLLSDGAKPSYVVEAAAREAGCAWATIRRAGDALGVVRWRPNGDTRWWWRLPDGTPQYPDRQVAHPLTHTSEQVDQVAPNSPDSNLLSEDLGEQHDGLTPNIANVSPNAESENGEPGEQVAQVAHPRVLRSEQLAPGNLLSTANGEQVDEGISLFADPRFMGQEGAQLAKMGQEDAACEARCAALREARGDRPMPRGGKALVVQHTAIYGRLETRVREFAVREVKPDAQHPCSVSVYCVEPRKRRGFYYTMRPTNIAYLTIESDAGDVIYDSRQDVPCDMDKWEETRARFAKQRAEMGATD